MKKNTVRTLAKTSESLTSAQTRNKNKKKNNNKLEIENSTNVESFRKNQNINNRPIIKEINPKMRFKRNSPKPCNSLA